MDDAVQAKCVVLGDHSTGKSALIAALSEVNKQASWEGGQAAAQAAHAQAKQDNVIFRSMVIPAAELQGTKSNLNMKIWEYSSHLSKEETELVLRGALFCIITFDLRNPESANSAFNSWLMLKETFMTESFLFVVGTHLDFATSRRVEVADLCKACAQKDAVYLEVSSTEMTNVGLLRKLLIQRMNFMLGVREEISRQAATGATASGESEDDDDDDVAARQADEMARRYEKLFKNAGDHPLLDTAFLEQEIISESVGSILSSALGTDFWPGYQAEAENLKKIGFSITDRVRELAMDPSSAPSTPLEFVLQSVPPPSAAQADSKSLPMPDVEELKHIFEIMGFSLPPSLLQPVTGAPGSSGAADGTNASVTTNANNKSPGPARGSAAGGNAGAGNNTIKLIVALPTGGSAEIQIYPGYHVGRQVETFLVQHGLEDDDDARLKLTRAAEQIAAKHFAKS